MDYRPRADSSDASPDDDDRWFDRRGLHQRVREILREHEPSTIGIAEVPCSLTQAEIEERISRWDQRLRSLGRIQEVDGTTVFHWPIAELIAYEALQEWWLYITEWPVGWWPWDHGGEAPPVPPPSG